MNRKLAKNISVSEAQLRLSSLVKNVRDKGERYVLGKGSSKAILISIEEYMQMNSTSRTRLAKLE